MLLVCKEVDNKTITAKNIYKIYKQNNHLLNKKGDMLSKN